MRCFLILSLTCITGLTTLAQERIILQHQKRQRKREELSMDKSFQYKLNDSTYHFGKIQHFDTEQITIVKYDSSLVSMDINEIELISRFRSQSRRWTEPFAYIGIGAAMTLAATPVVWAASGGDKALDALGFAGILTAGGSSSTDRHQKRAL